MTGQGPQRQSGWRRFIQRGGLWVVVQGLLQVPALGLAVIFPGQLKALSVQLLGAGLLVVGGIVGLAGVKALGRFRTPLPYPSDDSRLVQHGIYALIRHPLYTSALLVSAGWALLWQSLVALLAIPVLAVFYDAKARQEERWLRQRHPAYADYQRRVRRFIPWVY